MSTEPDPTDTPLEPRPRRRGRPRIADAKGGSARERLLEAAVEAAIDKGIAGASVGEIARRAGVTTGAIYAHFDSRADLMAAAARMQLGRLKVPPTAGPEALRDLARAYAADDFARGRRFYLELHTASLNDRDLAALIEAWQQRHAGAISGWLGDAEDADAAIKLYFLVLLGLCHLETVDALDVATEVLLPRIDALVDGIFANGPLNS